MTRLARHIAGSWRRPLRTVLAVMVGVAVSLTVTACHTVEGMGRDIEEGAQEVQDLVD